MTDPYVDIEQIAQTRAYSVKRVVRVKDQANFARKTLRFPSEEAAARFQSEARILARLDHPNIVRVVDQQLNVEPYFVVTPLYSSDLRGWLNHSLPLSHDAKRKIFWHLLDAVEYAHAQGVIHRDLKPENILLNSPDEVVVIDFNISLERTECMRYTVTGDRLGTPLYLAPEQLRDAKQADERADIYSLGVILYELFGGAIGSSTLATEGLPGLVKVVVEKCCNQQPTKRYQTVSELKRAWLKAIDLNGRQSEHNELETLILQGSSKRLSPSELDRVLALLDEYSDDLDLLDRFVMDSDVELLQDMATYDGEGFGALLTAWAEFFSQQSWPFDYTDKIANRCKELCRAVQSSGSRALLICALIVLARAHNRFYVWRVAAALIQETKTVEDTLALNQFLFAMDESHLDLLKEYVDVGSLRSSLRLLFSPRRAA